MVKLSIATFTLKSLHKLNVFNVSNQIDKYAAQPIRRLKILFYKDSSVLTYRTTFALMLPLKLVSINSDGQGMFDLN